MDIRPIKTWSYPGALLDALKDTRRSIEGIEMPIPTGREAEAAQLLEQIQDQLDHHLIPRLTQESSPAVVVVGGPTGAGKSTVVNALLGEQLTAAGVLRPTTKVPHLFHHPLDSDVLDAVQRRATVHATEVIARGLTIVDSPDLDSVRGENREIAQDLLEAADLWIFVTTPGRYGDAIPWHALRRAAARGASVAVVLNRVTPDVAAHIRLEVVDRLRQEELSGLPLFVIPEDADYGSAVPRDVVGSLGRWLDTVASASAGTIVERTLHGSIESVKDWLEELALFMDEQAAAAKDLRALVRRKAARVEVTTPDDWYREIGAGAVQSRWAHEGSHGGALFQLAPSLVNRRRSARERRDAALAPMRADLLAAIEASLALAAHRASSAMIESLGEVGGDVGTWLASQRDPRDARTARERRAADAARTWIDRCAVLAMEMPAADRGALVVGDDGMATVLASAAAGVDEAARALAVLGGAPGDDVITAARTALTTLRSEGISREALDYMRPTDIASLSPDASSKVRLRRAELRALL